ncbi:protein GOLM2-like isoform X2 [Physella acuta]|uniref:protein GOLM2-like isoform X2 n=1 Tax=Physella acuta TaxID=109671 RepID=UPI0027DB3407|nr:protein GOLM2-like isoform X2 [Physella acuta]
MTGSAGNRSNMRSPGRTPPFILIGLLVLVCFLAYSYWSFYAENSLLKSEIETVLVQKKDVDDKRSDSEKNLEISREEVRRLQASNDQLQKQLQEKDAEINTVKTDVSKKQTEFEELQKNLANCDGSLARSTKDLEDAKNQNIELGKALEEEKKKPSTCDINTCINPIKGVIDVAAKVAGTDVLGKALADAKFDAAKLMEGIALYEPARQQQPVPIAGQPGAAA